MRISSPSLLHHQSYLGGQLTNWKKTINHADCRLDSADTNSQSEGEFLNGNPHLQYFQITQPGISIVTPPYQKVGTLTQTKATLYTVFHSHHAQYSLMHHNNL